MPRLISVGAVIVALLMLGLVFTPARVWRHPKDDAVYASFDSNLMYISAQGAGSATGGVEVSKRSMRVTAPAGSEPTVDLVTSALAFKATMDVTVVQTGSDGFLRLGLWNPGIGNGYFLKFGPQPLDTVAVERVKGGRASSSLVGGDVTSEQLGTYVPGQPYRVSMYLDKGANSITTNVSALSSLPFSGKVLRLGDVAGSAIEARSAPVAVVPRRTYEFGGWIDNLAGNQPYAVGILWFDRNGQLLPFDNWWRDAAELNGWTRKSLTATAPGNAAAASVFLGSGASSTYLFAQLSLRALGQQDSNLLANGDFSLGEQGWRICQPPGSCRIQRTLDLTQWQPLSITTTVNAAEFPEFFQGFRPTLAVSLTAGQGTSAALFENYSLTLPSQPTSAGELVERIDDGTARAAALLLGILGAILCLAALIWSPRFRELLSKRTIGILDRRIVFRLWHAIGLIALVPAYLFLNATLFPLGTPHFDTYAPKVWSYIAAQYGLVNLYHWPLVVPGAAVQGGIPIHEASFPYGPTKAYYYLAIGWLYSSLTRPGPVLVDTYRFEFLLKLFNVLFALAGAWLIYRIITGFGARPWTAVAVVLLFALNPATIFLTSVWGSTETISLFFMLLSIWLAVRRRANLAWIALALGAFTRPQMIVLAFLLGCVYLRSFPLGSNIQAISWGVIAFVIMLTPFSIAIAPSMPVDYMLHVVGFQIGTGQADSYSAVSPGYYSIWTLPLLYANSQHGLNRMWYPRTADIFGPVSYTELGAVVVSVFLLAVGAAIMLRRSGRSIAELMPFVALGMFGWLMLSTSLISRYFLYGLVLVIVCRVSFTPRFYYPIVAWLTFVTLLTSWSHFGLDELGYQLLSNPLNPTNSAVTRAVMALFVNDHFITVATTLNILVLLYLAVLAIRRQSAIAGEVQTHELEVASVG